MLQIQDLLLHLVSRHRPGEGTFRPSSKVSSSLPNNPAQAKMIYSSSKDALRRSLSGVHAEIQGTDPSEVALETVLEKASRGR